MSLDDFPNSPYARELRKGLRLSGFEPVLESDYRASHLDRVRLRVRVWFLLSAVLSVLFTLDQVRRTSVGNANSLAHLVILIPCTFSLCGLTWSRLYERRWLTWAPVLVAVFCMLISVFIAGALARGQDEQLAALAVNLVAVFFFSGLLFRSAVPICVLTVVTFAVAALLASLPAVMVTRSLVILSVTGIICAIVKRDMERSYRQSFLEGMLLGELAARDGLSGLMNRRAFDEHLLRIWQHGLRDQRTIAVLMVDIDHFKHFNDHWGHQAGDVVIRSVAQVLQGLARRPLDLAARYGGEEFGVLLYDLAFPHVQDIVQRLCEGVRNLRVASGEPVTVSVGVAWVTPMLGRTPQGAVQLADEALYEAKETGRNRVVVKGAEEYKLLQTGVFAHRPAEFR